MTMDSERLQYLESPGARLAQLVPQPEPHEIQAEADALAHSYKQRYGTATGAARDKEALDRLDRSALAAATAASRGTWISGTTQEVVSAIRYRFPDFPIGITVTHAPAAAQVGGFTSAPGQAPSPAGDPAIAAETLSHLYRRR